MELLEVLKVEENQGQGRGIKVTCKVKACFGFYVGSPKEIPKSLKELFQEEAKKKGIRLYENGPDLKDALKKCGWGESARNAVDRSTEKELLNSSRLLRVDKKPGKLAAGEDSGDRWKFAFRFDLIVERTDSVTNWRQQCGVQFSNKYSEFLKSNQSNMKTIEVAIDFDKALEQVSRILKNLPPNQQQEIAETLIRRHSNLPFGWVYAYKLPVDVKIDNSDNFCLVKIGMVKENGSLLNRLRSEMLVFDKSSDKIPAPFDSPQNDHTDDQSYIEFLKNFDNVMCIIATPSPEQLETKLAKCFGNAIGGKKKGQNSIIIPAIISAHCGKQDWIDVNDQKTSILLQNWIIFPEESMSNQRQLGATEWYIMKNEVFGEVRKLWIDKKEDMKLSHLEVLDNLEPHIEKEKVAILRRRVEEEHCVLVLKVWPIVWPEAKEVDKAAKELKPKDYF